jgi:hypothetical protein
MNARFLAIVLVGSALFFASSARATSVRTGSGYGQLNGAPSQLETIGTEYQICYPNTGSSLPDCGMTGVTDMDDLFLQIPSPVSGTFEISIPNLATSSFAPAPGSGLVNSGTPLFGLVTCDEGSTSGQLGTVCTPTTAGTPTVADNTCATDLAAAATSVSGTTTTIILPTSCTGLAGATLYFDQTSPGFAPVSETSAAAPEPSSLALFGLALIPLMLFSKRRAQA